MKGTKEFYDMMSDFENSILDVVYISGEIERESKDMINNKHYYKNGEVDKMFKVFMSGYMLGRLNYIH